MVTEERQEFLGRLLSRTTKGFIFIVSEDCVKRWFSDFGFGGLKGANNLVFEKHHEDGTILNEDGQRCHTQMLGRLLWLDRPDIKNAVCQLSTHVGTATNRDEASVWRIWSEVHCVLKLRVARWTYWLQLLLRWVQCW